MSLVSSRRLLLENIACLAVLQAVNYIAPLITLPYLARVLHPAHFGLLAYAQSIILYFDLFTDFGFNFSATRAIARVRHDSCEVARIFWSTICAKVLLMCVSAIVLTVLLASLPGFRGLRALLTVNFLYVIGTTFFPVWYFQGTEQLKIAAICSGIGRLLTVPALIVLVRTQDDYLRAGAIQASVEITATIVCLPYLLRNLRLAWYRPSVRDLLGALREGWPLFLSASALQISASSTIVIIGETCGVLQVGYFSAADKVVRASTAVLNPIGLALYPRIGAVKMPSPEAALRLIRKSLIATAAIGCAASLAILIGAHPFSRMILGRSFDKSAAVLQLLSPLPLLFGLMSVLGTQTMLVFGMDAVFSRIMICSVAAALPITFALSTFLGAAGAAIASDLLSTAIVAAMVVVLLSEGLPVWRRSGITGIRKSGDGSLAPSAVHGNH